jgi:hypothetical protein
MSSRGTAAVLMNSALLLIFFLCAGAGLLAATAPDIPAGTEIQVRVIENLNSGTARLGDIFHGTLDEPIVVSGKQLFPKGADVTGTISLRSRGTHAGAEYDQLRGHGLLSDGTAPAAKGRVAYEEQCD